MASIHYVTVDGVHFQLFLPIAVGNHNTLYHLADWL